MAPTYTHLPKISSMTHTRQTRTTNINKIKNKKTVPCKNDKTEENTYEFSLSVPSKCPLIFHMNIVPSLEPAASRLVSRLNDTRDQSQLTLKLSLLFYWRKRERGNNKNRKRKETDKIYSKI